MTTDPDLDRVLRHIARALVAEAPEAPDSFRVRAPTSSTSTGPTRRSAALIVAASVIVVGAAGLVAVRLGGDDDPTAVGGPGGTALSALLPTTTLAPATAPTSAQALPGALTPPPAPTTTPGEQHHVVAMGDYLAGIAERFGVTVEALAEYNQWPDGANHPLFVGDVVRIPPVAANGDAAELPATSSLVGTSFLVRERRRRRRQASSQTSMPS